MSRPKQDPPPYKEPAPPTNFPIAAKPRREIFDPWNSSATGHQRAENRLSGSTSWRDSRSAKLAVQFGSGAGGGKRVADTVGAGSESFERGERTANGGWKRGVVRDRASGQISLWESFGVPTKGVYHDDEAIGSTDISVNKTRRVAVEEVIEKEQPRSLGDDAKGDTKSSQHSFTLSQESHMPSPPPEDDDPLPALYRSASNPDPDSSAKSYDTALLNSIYGSAVLINDYDPPQSAQPISSAPTPPSIVRRPLKRSRSASPTSPSPPARGIAGPTAQTSSTTPPQIFRNLTIYINGSTYPAISDHKLKHLLVTHGANISIMLGRRAVTHVILGESAGGGLAAGKIQKEVARVRSSGGKGVKFVSVQWVLACVEAGKRVGEREFEVVGTGPAGVRGVHKVFGKAA